MSSWPPRASWQGWRQITHQGSSRGFFFKVESYKSDMKWDELKKGFTHVEAKIEYSLTSSSLYTCEVVLFYRLRPTWKSQACMRESHVCELYSYLLAEGKCEQTITCEKMNVKWSNGGSVIVISESVYSIFDGHKLVPVSVPEGWWRATPSTGIEMLILTASPPYWIQDSRTRSGHVWRCGKAAWPGHRHQERFEGEMIRV